jgi:ADP-dependent NAD(P)H-hydrate dehydratase
VSVGPVPVTDDLLHSMPLPQHREGDDKDGRGRVLVIGGSVEVPGAALLSGLAALRAGAGKLQIATSRSVAVPLALAVPEARVTGMRETPEGEISPDEAGPLAERIGQSDATVIGPGMMDGSTAGLLTYRLLVDSSAVRTKFVIDAAALHRLLDCETAIRKSGAAGDIVITPHAGEMATLLGTSMEQVLSDRLGAARRAAARLQVVVAMKGGCTFVVSPGGQAWTCDRGNVGLATSGSGDTLAGIIGGLLARGAAPVEATLWGVFLHGEAGARLAKKCGPIGFLARELLAEIPPTMAATGGATGSS